MKCRAYIIEDSATLRESLVEALRELARIEPVGAAGGTPEATRWLQAHRDDWDVAIVGLYPRGGRGYDLLEVARTRAPGQKVVVLGDPATGDLRARCAELGADAVFDKSTEIDALIAFFRTPEGETLH